MFVFPRKRFDITSLAKEIEPIKVALLGHPPRPAFSRRKCSEFLSKDRDTLARVRQCWRLRQPICNLSAA